MKELREVRQTATVGGVLIAVFQLVGRSQAERFVHIAEMGWYLELRLWVLAALSIWLMGVAAVSGINRFHAGGVRACGGMIVAFLGYMVITSVWAPDPERAAAKVYDVMFVIWSAALIVAALRMCGVGPTIEGFWRGLYAGGLALAAIGVATAVGNAQGVTRLSVLSGGPNVFGRNMGLLALVSLRLIFDRRRLLRIIGLVTAPLAALLVLLSGSRGAMLALFFGVIVYLSVHGVDRRVFWSLLAVGVAGIAALATRFGELAVLVFRERFLILLLAEQYFTHRDVLLLEGLRAGLQYPFGGLGLSGFATVGTRGSHPHNIFLEAFSEGGFPGLVLLCFPFVLYASRWRRGMGAGDSLTVAGLGLLTVSSSISGDLFDARGVFLLLLMAIASQRPEVSRQRRST